jgi:hypothetical protein
MDKNRSVKTDAFGNKVKIFIACWGTFVGFGIIICTILILTGLDDKIRVVLEVYFSIGLIFIIFWPFYSKRLK